MKNQTRRLWPVLAALLWVPSTAFAQGGSMRPLFGGATTNNARENLDFNVSLGSGYDNDLYADELVSSTLFATLSPRIDFASRTARLQVGATAGSELRYFNDVGQLEVMNHSVGAGVSAQIARRTNVFVNQSVSYAPAYLYGLFAPVAPPAVGDVIPPATDFSVTRGQVASYAYATTANFSHGLSSRAEMLLGASLRYTNFTENSAGLLNMHSHAANARLTYSLSRDFRARLDYSYRQTGYSLGPEHVEHALYGGVEYNFGRFLRTRRTTFSFNVGPTAAKGISTSDQGLNTSETFIMSQGRYLVTADALVTHRMARTWSASGGFHRGFAYIEGLPDPVFTNATTLGTRGFFNRRTELEASFASSVGDASTTPFNTYAGDVRLQFAMTSELATYVQYFHYYYRFDRNLPLPLGVPHDLARNGVRAGLTLWVPLMRRR